MKKRDFLSAAALVIFLVSLFLPPMGGLSRASIQVLGIFISTMILWLGVSITWPSLFCIAALAVTPFLKGDDVLVNAFGNWIPTFCIFTSVLCYALSKTGFLQRVAVWMLTRKIARKTPFSFVAVLFLTPLVVGSIMGTVALFSIFIPLLNQIFIDLNYKREDKTAQVLMFGVMFTSCMSAMTTPISHTFSLMAISYHQQFFPGEEQIPIVTFSIVGILSSIIVYALLLVTKYIIRPDLSGIKELDIGSLVESRTPLSAKEIVSVSVFALVVAAWLLPGILGEVFPAAAAFLTDLGNVIPAIIGVILLFVIKVGGEPILDFDDTFKNGAPWRIWLLVAAAMALGSAITSDEAGLLPWFSGIVEPVVAGLPSMAAVLLITFMILFLTNMMSNAVALILVSTVMLPLIASGAISGVSGAAVAINIGMAANVAVSTPLASAPAVMSVGTGWLSNSNMLKWGAVMTILTCLIMTFVSYNISLLLI